MSIVAFRLEANSIVGTGHLMRCLTIAQDLRKLNYSCHFLCSKLTRPLNHLLSRQGNKVHAVDNEKKIHMLIENLRPELLIIDHYELDATYERKVSGFCKRILVIDDLADRSHECDFLLDQGPLRTIEDYQPWVNGECKYFLGTKFALIKPEFRQKRKLKITSWKRGLICFGGSDPSNITLQILKALDEIIHMQEIKWTVLAGAANPHWGKLKKFAKQSSLNITMLKQSDKIGELMANHDFSIGAAGGMIWERACIGLPSLTIPIAYNQRFGIEEIKHFCLGQTLEVSEICPNSLAIALGELQHRANDYLKRNQIMVDGFGVKRLISKLKFN
jgi:UDP-2,4-diacetamido-2,4,6-trideoxy-beta-L-altropyranose hydrolase